MSEENEIDTAGVSPAVQNMSAEAMEQAIEAHKPNVPESKPSIFDNDADAKLTKEMGKVYDKSTAKDDFILGKRDVPSAKADNFNSAFESTYKWLNETPKAEQERMRDASALVDQVRDNAKKFGVELTEQEAMARAMELEYTLAQEAKEAAGNPYNGAAEAMRSVYKDHDPNETAQWFAQVKQSFDQDPIAATSWAAEQYGLSPLQLAQQIYQRYGQQESQPTQADVGRVQNIVEQAFAQNPRLEELNDDILNELKSESFKRSGDAAADLRWAVKRAEAKNRKRSTGDKIDRSMNATYSRMNKR